MTLAELHQQKDLQALYVDPRFIALTLYLRSNRPRITSADPHIVIKDGGRLEGWLECLEKMEEASIPPQLRGNVERPIPYAKPHPENNS